MDDKEKLESWKRKNAVIGNRIAQLRKQRDVLLSLLNEAKAGRNIRLNSCINGIDLSEEISCIQDWIKFHEKGISIYGKKILALEAEISRDRILEEQFKEIDKEAGEIARREKEISQGYATEPEVKIPSPEEIKKDAEEPEESIEEKDIKAEFKEKPLPDFKHLGEEAKAERHELVISERQLIKYDEKAAAIIAKSFEEKPEINTIKEQPKGLFKGGKRPWHLRLGEGLAFLKKSVGSIRFIPSFAAKRLAPLKPVDKKHAYVLSILLLLIVLVTLFISKPEITGYVALTRENKYIDGLNLVINESGNYTWAPDNAGYMQSIRAGGRVIGNGTIRVYIEKDGERYLIYDNKKSR